MNIKWTLDASSDLDNMLAYIAAQGPQGAVLTVDRVLKTETYILQFPYAAQYDEETNTYDRYILKTRIILTYEVIDDTIWVIRAWHTSRDPKSQPK